MAVTRWYSMAKFSISRSYAPNSRRAVIALSAERTVKSCSTLLRSGALGSFAGSTACLRLLFGIATKAILTLARDRFGVKPLYWAEEGSCFLFGSEIKALLAHGALKSVIDLEGLAEYLAFQNFFTSRTLFRGVQLLPQGSYIQLRAGQQPAKPVKYWDFHFEEPATCRNDDDYLEELDHLFQQAVSRQLISDVEIGSYLSGGMDSGSITALAGRQLPWIRTFTVGFDLNSASGVEMGYDERSAAEYMSYLFKTEHYEMVLKAGDMERILPETRLASRGTARRAVLSEFLRGAACVQICKGCPFRGRRR